MSAVAYYWHWLWKCCGEEDPNEVEKDFVENCVRNESYNSAWEEISNEIQHSDNDDINTMELEVEIELVQPIIKKKMCN